MKEEIKFLYDNSLLTQEEIENVLREVQKKPRKTSSEAIFLRKFVLTLYEVAKKKNRIVEIKRKPSIIRREIKPVVIEEEIKPLPAPIPEYPEYPVIRSQDNVVLVRVELKDHVYSVKEPILNENEEVLLLKLKEKLRSKIISNPTIINNENLISKLLTKFSKKLSISISKDLYRRIHYYLVKDILDYGKINVLLRDSNVEEIKFESLDQSLIIKYNNFEDIKTNVKFESINELNNLVKKLFDKANQRLTKQNNYLDTDSLGFQVKATYDFEGKETKFEIKKLK